MNLFKKITAALILISLSVPYTAFAENNSVSSPEQISVFSEEDDIQKNVLNPIELDDKMIALYESFAQQLGEHKDMIDLSGFDITINEFITEVCLKDNMQIYLTNEHPEIFYYDFDTEINMMAHLELSTSQVFGSDQDGPMTQFMPVYTMDADDVAVGNAAIKAETDHVLEQIDDNMTDYEKILYVHDYIASNYNYDTSVYTPELADNAIRTLDKTVERRRCVCQGYSYLFKHLLNALGIECITVPSSELEHMWNKVKLDGVWYNVDITYDDPVPAVKNPASNNISSAISHKYFLVTDEKIKALDSSKEVVVGYKYVLDEDGNPKTDEEGNPITEEVYGESSHHCIWDEKDWKGKPLPTSDTEFADADLTSISGATAYLDGTFYFIEDKKIYSLVYDSEAEAYEKKLVHDIGNSYKWYLPPSHPQYSESTRYFYDNSFTSLVAFDGKLYYNTPNSIYEYNPDTDTADIFYVYGDAPGEDKDVSNTYFYGLHTDKTTLYGEYTSNVDNGLERTVKIAEKTKVINPIIEEAPCTVSTEITNEASGEITVTANISLEALLKHGNNINVYIAEYDGDNTLIKTTPLDTSEAKTKSFIPDLKCATIKTFIWAIAQNQLEPLSYVTPYSVNQNNGE